MAIRKAMSKKTDPPAKKQTSAAGPYKSGMKTDKSTGVRKMTKPAAPKAKGGSQFLPKGVPAGSKANTPKSKTQPRTVNTYPGSIEEKIKSGGKVLVDEAKGMTKSFLKKMDEVALPPSEYRRKYGIK
jgi:hypothetical protein